MSKPRVDPCTQEEARKAIATHLSTLAACVLEGEVSAFEVSLTEDGKFRLSARASAIGSQVLKALDGAPVS